MRRSFLFFRRAYQHGEPAQILRQPCPVELVRQQRADDVQAVHAYHILKALRPAVVELPVLVFFKRLEISLVEENGLGLSGQLRYVIRLDVVAAVLKLYDLFF